MTVIADVSVVVPHYQDLVRLDACLAALEAQTLPRHRFEIIVADNRSPVGRSAVEQVIAGRARFVDAPEAGAGPARNRGVEEASGRIIAFTDCDCVPDPRWLEEGIGKLSQFDLVGGEMYVVAPDGQMSGEEAFEVAFAFNNRRYVLDEHFTVTANLFCRRETFLRVGQFRIDVAEDKEWCLRARDCGYRIGYAEKARVGHPARSNWAELKGKWRRLMQEGYALTLERQGRLVWLARTWAMLPSIPFHAVTILTTRKLKGLAVRLRALRTLVVLRLWRFCEGHRLLFAGSR